MKTKLRVLHCPDNVGGNPFMIAKYEREAGLESWSVCLEKSKYQFDVDEVLFGRSSALNEIKRWVLFIRALFWFDVIHFNFGRTIFPIGNKDIAYSSNRWVNLIYYKYAVLFRFFDLKMFSLFNKVVVVTFQGDDARLGSFCKENFHVNATDEAGYYSESMEFLNRLKIRYFSKYADQIYYLNPDLAYVLPDDAKFLPYASVDAKKWTACFGSDGLEVPRVIHAPSNRGVKGTKYILDAVSRLQADGIKFEFILVENMTNAEAIEVYKTADLLIDQLLLGWYGGLAVELMALGKPVIAFIRDEDLRVLPSSMKDELPIINASPDSIYDVLRENLTSKKNNLRSIGVASRHFVEKWHSPAKIVENLKQDYLDIKRNKKY